MVYTVTADFHEDEKFGTLISATPCSSSGVSRTWSEGIIGKVHMNHAYCYDGFTAWV